ncbi:MAG TPA: hypothetical protein VKG78_09740 [Opitutaceae bacterium]|nr:hypothetical protein [Opitutaceae bacterium]
MSDRLEELRRQRGLLRDHLGWLDREIAALEGAAAPAQNAAPAPAPAGASSVDGDAEAILAEFRRPAVSIQKQAKVGCLIYFAIGLAAMALSVAILYVLVKRAHGR